MGFKEARASVLERVHGKPAMEEVTLEHADGRVLAEDVAADRDYPPVARSVRDGFAVRAAEGGGERAVIGEVRAGEEFAGMVGAGQAVEIMTGAPMPEGADAVIMVEHVVREGDRIRTDRTIGKSDFVNPRGSEAHRGDVVVARGARLDFARIAMAATVGCSTLRVFRQPRVAILATGDEVVPIEDAPLDHQVRNSNSFSIAAQVRRAGGVPEILPVARDTKEATRELIERGLAADLLLLAGGVSAGKYDVVETVLAELGAEFYFDRVRIQPGQPLVFGRVKDKFFFGLPGNPGSTMVTFELFARAAVERLAGIAEPALPFAFGRLTRRYVHRMGLTRFLPAMLDGDGRLTPIATKGSSDVPALARSNVFLVADEDREIWEAGEWMRVLAK